MLGTFRLREVYSLIHDIQQKTVRAGADHDIRLQSQPVHHDILLEFPDDRQSQLCQLASNMMSAAPRAEYNTRVARPESSLAPDAGIEASDTRTSLDIQLYSGHKAGRATAAQQTLAGNSDGTQDENCGLQWIRTAELVHACRSRDAPSVPIQMTSPGCNVM